MPSRTVNSKNSTPQQLFELGVDVPSKKVGVPNGVGVEKVLSSKWVGISSKLVWVEKRGNASYLGWKPPQNP